MGSPKTKSALERLGHDIRTARLRRGIAVADLAVRAGTSPSSIGRLEKGDRQVAWGSLLAAAEVLGMELHLGIGKAATGGEASAILLDETLPLHIRLKDYPGLRLLAWQVGEAVDTLSPREAFGLYTRNARHLQEDELLPGEQSLLRALRHVFGETAADV